MKYKKNNLIIDNLKVETLAKKYSTPLYCYSLKKIRENIINFKENFKDISPLTCFAVKANPNKVLLKEIGKTALPNKSKISIKNFKKLTSAISQY